ncbi:DUF397 domain-containing protein [Nocardia carnea]|uniref:DUF397 domain-containing protein n=1 Tax=Nocardia carnea TaxID=37328 RepID=A0ABW7TL22_9NOCA|nr:DUF397 domain-containing protein [Nocardia carnea]
MRSSWYKSSFSGSEHTCVEVRFAGKTVFIRDSKYRRNPGNDPARQPVIEVPISRWEAFLASAVTPGTTSDPELPVVISSAFGVTVSAAQKSLRFTNDEWSAFIAGIVGGEFTAA